jgi:hypothetical protein
MYKISVYLRTYKKKYNDTYCDLTLNCTTVWRAVEQVEKQNFARYSVESLQICLPRTAIG